jgi:hypothetical protein
VMWLPKEIESLSVSKKVCPQPRYKSPIHKLKISLRRGAIPPGHPPRVPILLQPLDLTRSTLPVFVGATN